MAKKPDKTSDRSRSKSRRKIRCANHPKARAVARCEICRRPVCKECIEYYEGAHICSEPCWNEKLAEERARVAAEERLRRKKREQRANRAVSIGMWLVALTVLGVIGVYIRDKVSDRSGEKLWEHSSSGKFFHYSAQPHLKTVCATLGDGSVAAFDVRTGKQKWSVSVPETENALRTRMLDENRCLAYSGNRIFLLRSALPAPAWEYVAPQSALCAEPVILNDRLYAASAPADELYSILREVESVATGLSRSREPSRIGPYAGREPASSTISAIDIASGDEHWKTELEDIRVRGLLADENRIYAAGYRLDPGNKYAHATSRERTRESDYSEEEELPGITQLWALNAGTGKPEWKLDGTGRFMVSPKLSREGIIFSTWSNVYLVSKDGEERWDYPLPRSGAHTLESSEDKLFLATCNGFLICLDLRSGQKKWIVDIGASAERIVVSSPFVCVAGQVEVEEAPIKVRPTKRWEGSEDLLRKALKSRGTSYEPVLLGIDAASGEIRWSIPKIEEEFEHSGGILYALRHFSRLQFMDASADPSELAKTVSNLGAYDSMTGEKIWETAIDGYASDLHVAGNVALVRARPAKLSFAAGGGGPRRVRLIGISLE